MCGGYSLASRRDFRGRAGAESRAMAWILVAWAGVSVAALSYLGVPEKLRDLRTPYAERPAFDASKDPKVGTTVPLPETDVLGRSIRRLAMRAERVILVVYGSCDDCSTKHSDPLRVRRGGNDLVIVLWSSPTEIVRRRAEQLPAQYAAVADSAREATRALNVYWTPRYYELDHKLRVIVCQSRGDKARWER